MAQPKRRTFQRCAASTTPQRTSGVLMSAWASTQMMPASGRAVMAPATVPRPMLWSPPSVMTKWPSSVKNVVEGVRQARRGGDTTWQRGRGDPRQRTGALARGLPDLAARLRDGVRVAAVAEALVLWQERCGKRMGRGGGGERRVRPHTRTKHRHGAAVVPGSSACGGLKLRLPRSFTRQSRRFSHCGGRAAGGQADPTG